MTFQDQIAHILPKTQDEPPIKYSQMITQRIHSTYIHWLIYPKIMYICTKQIITIGCKKHHKMF